MTLSARASRIRAVALDIDGVLTDGRIGYGADSDEIKFFDVKDGLGIKLLQRAGIKVGVVSGRSSKANRTRIAELGLDFTIEGSRDKACALEEVARQLRVQTSELLFIGDDLVDLPAFGLAGVKVAVGDAVDEVKAAADITTSRPGGHGAIREAAEWLLKQQDKWTGLVQQYLGTGGRPAAQA